MTTMATIMIMTTITTIRVMTETADKRRR